LFIPILFVYVSYLATLPVDTLESVEDKMINKYAAAGEIRTGKRNLYIRAKLAPMPLRPPQIPHDLTFVQIQVAEWGTADLESQI
jgi:hypothetical protein